MCAGDRRHVGGGKASADGADTASEARHLNRQEALVLFPTHLTIGEHQLTGARHRTVIFDTGAAQGFLQIGEAVQVGIERRIVSVQAVKDRDLIFNRVRDTVIVVIRVVEIRHAIIVTVHKLPSHDVRYSRSVVHVCARLGEFDANILNRCGDQRL